MPSSGDIWWSRASVKRHVTFGEQGPLTLAGEIPNAVANTQLRILECASEYSRRHAAVLRDTSMEQWNLEQWKLEALWRSGSISLGEASALGAQIRI